MKAVPGRKTDVKDAEWISDLLRHGLRHRPVSFPPNRPGTCVIWCAIARRWYKNGPKRVNRLQKVLETATIKLSSVGSLVMGKSGQRMVAAMIEGISDAEALAELARGTLRRKLPQLQQALNGQIEAHHRVLLQRIFAHMSFLEDSIHHLQLEIDQRLRPFTEAMQLLLSIPGIQAITAAAILAEIGCEMARFPSAKHLARLRGSLSREQTKWRQAPFRQDH
jgi:transposase